MPFYLEHLPDILAALPEICPNLRRLKFEMSSRGHADFINSERNASLFQCNGEFESLEELRLPFTGLHYDLVASGLEAPHLTSR